MVDEDGRCDHCGAFVAEPEPMPAAAAVDDPGLRLPDGRPDTGWERLRPPVRE
jgi:hypothetical protein